MKLLIISVSAGSGHVQVANALQQEAEAQYIDSQHIDMMEYVSKPMKLAIVDAYDKVASDYPRIWKQMYVISDDPKRMKWLDKLMALARKLSDQAFFDFVRTYKPTHIICTHPFPAQALEAEGIIDELSVDLSVVVTDYGMHAFWLVEGVRQYMVATDAVKKQLAESGVGPRNVQVTGIPIRKEFFELPAQEDLQKKYKTIDKKVALLLSGGQGLAHSEEVAQQFVEHWQGEPLVVIAVAGSNTELKAKLENIAVTNENEALQVKVFGWTDVMHELMQLADVVVSKPGGSTVSECVALKKPMVVFDPIPGQEEYNVDFLKERKLGTIASSTYECVELVQDQLVGKPKDIQEKSNPAKQVISSVCG